jgi:(S)-2-hydroxy-acid oxidase
MAEEPVNVNEFQELARQVLPKMYFDFYNGGAEDQYTLKENMEAFHRITLSIQSFLLAEKDTILNHFFGLVSFRPRILVDVSRISMSTTILGHHIAAPIMIAPTSFHKLAHPEGLN